METFFIVILALTSIIGLTFIIERGLALRWNRVIPPGVETAAAACRSAGDRPMLRRVCEQYGSPPGRLLLAGEAHMDMAQEDNRGARQTPRRPETVGPDRRV